MKDALTIALLGFFAIAIFIVLKFRSPVVQVADVKPTYSLPDGLPVGDNAPGGTRTRTEEEIKAEWLRANPGYAVYPDEGFIDVSSVGA